MTIRGETSADSAGRFLAIRRAKRKRRRRSKPSQIKGPPTCALVRIDDDGDHASWLCACGRSGGFWQSSPQVKAYVLSSWRSHARSKLCWLTRRKA